VTWAELHISSGLTAVLAALVPVFLALQTLRSEPLGARGWAGALLGFAGVVVLMAPERSERSSLAGSAAVVLSTALWAWATLYLRKNVSGGGPLTNAGIQMLVAAGIGVTAAPATGGFLRAPVAGGALLALLYLAIVGSCLAFTAFGYLTHVWPATRAGTYAYLNPMVAVVLGAAILDEPFGPRLVLGMLVILAGVALIQFGRRKV